MAKDPNTNVRLFGGILMAIAVGAAVFLPLTITGTPIVDTLSNTHSSADVYKITLLNGRIVEEISFDRDVDLTAMTIWMRASGLSCPYVTAWVSPIQQTDPDSAQFSIYAHICGGNSQNVSGSGLIRLTAGLRYGVFVQVTSGLFEQETGSYLGVVKAETGATHVGLQFLKDVTEQDNSTATRPIALELRGSMAAVEDEPSAEFEWAATGLSVQFTDRSTAPANQSIAMWTWDFGDGSPTNAEQNPRHVYSVNGTYAVRLIVVTAAGSSDDVTTSLSLNSETDDSGQTDEPTDPNKKTTQTGATDVGPFTLSWMLVLFAALFGFGTYLLSKGAVKAKNEQAVRAGLGIAGGLAYLLIFALVL